MITTTTLLLSLLAAPQEIESRPAPGEVAAKIRAAIKEGSAPALEMIERFGDVCAREVTAALGAGLKHKDRAVQIAAVKALRYNSDRSAFTELFRVRGTKAIMGKPDVAAEYYLALGQHRDKRALPFLVKDLRAKGRRDKVIGRRILALGRIRERTSIDAIIKFMRASRGNSKEAVTALIVLTGRNEGKKWVGWARWWKANRASFTVSKDEPKLDKRQAKTWTKVWAVPGSESAKAQRRNAKRNAKGSPEPAGKSDGVGNGGKKSGGGNPGRGRNKDEREQKR
jgi:hypothetical protein